MLDQNIISRVQTSRKIEWPCECQQQLRSVEVELSHSDPLNSNIFDQL